MNCKKKFNHFILNVEKAQSCVTFDLNPGREQYPTASLKPIHTEVKVEAKGKIAFDVCLFFFNHVRLRFCFSSV